MKTYKAVSKIIVLKGAGETLHFDLHLAGDAKTIVGVETSVRFIDPIVQPAPPTTFAGSFVPRFSLQTGSIRIIQPGCNGTVYSGAVKAHDSETGVADFSIRPGWEPHIFSHGRSRFQDDISAEKQSPLLNCIYQDTVKNGKRYAVSVHLWYEIKSIKNECLDHSLIPG